MQDNPSPVTSWITFLDAQEGYRRMFLEANGPGPWPCHFCGDPITEIGGNGGRNLIVHHVDGDHSNDAPGNHAAAHWDCHSGYHARIYMATLTPEERSRRSQEAARALWDNITPEEMEAVSAKFSRANSGVSKSLDHRAKISAANTGKPKSPAHRAKLSAAAKNRSPQHRAKLSTAAALLAPLMSCTYCGREIRGLGNLARHERACRSR